VGHLFLPSHNGPIPTDAQIVERDGQRVARWRGANGKLCTAEIKPTSKGDRIAVQGTRYIARYKDGNGVTRTVATGCRDESAARAKLGELERRAELVLAGVLTAAEDAVSEHKREPITLHVDEYIASLKARGTTPKHVVAQRRLLTVVIKACEFRSLADIRRESVERWLAGPENARRSARTRNTYANAAKWFCNWCVETERLVSSPLARVQRADENADRRRQPRALTEEELVRLLDAARRRPLVEALKFNRGWRKGQPGARLRPETRARLEALGHERALVYKTLVLTGLRLGELASIRVCDVVLDGERPHIDLDPRHEKNRAGSLIPLRADLCAELRTWIGARRTYKEAGGPQRPLFAINQSLVKILDRDLRFAGIAKRDDRGRTACVHSLRHTFATLMSRGGVAPRVAQAAMRHSTIDLTMRVYTDPRLLDVAGALRALPELPLDFGALTPTGTDARAN
jgi:integrase